MFSPGSVIGDARAHYQIVRPLGRGGMGEVYEAMQMPLARRVAVKTIRSDLAARPELLARFRREAESAAALGHPNLVQVTDFHDAPGEAPFLVMEMLDGATLASVLEQERRLDPPRAAFIGVQLLSGLAAAHRAGIVHRDVKPANVFLQSTTAMRDLVKVLDFGVAKLALDATPGAHAMTQAGEVLGTLAYMAPEQAVSGAAIDARTDIYGVGATLFHALSGVRPFDATEPGGGRTPLERIAPWVQRELAAVIERALQRAPEGRWATAEEMALALQPFAAGAGAAGSSASAPPPQAASGAPAARPEMAGWDPSAIGRLEAPTGGSSFGSSLGGSSFGGASQGADATSGSSYGRNHQVSAAAPPGAVPIVMRSPSDAYAPTAHAPPSPYGPSGYGPPGPQGPSPYGPVAYVPTAYGPPANAPTAYGPGYGAAPYGAPLPMQPMHGMPGKPARPWWLLVVGLVVLAAGGPYLLSFLAFRNATNPDTIATNVEREILKQPKPACPQFEQCSVKREEHGLTFALCTKSLTSSSTYRPGEMVLGGDDTRVGIITAELGNHRHTVRFLTAKAEQEIGDDQIVGRLCRAGSRGGSGQTVP